ncbi:unnamed protein product [Camellia sinensis]
MGLIICKDAIQYLEHHYSPQPINDRESIISSNKVFQLGFFSLVNTTNRYVGIWYNNIPVRTVVWVANRDRPLIDSFRSLMISKDGNLVVLNGQKEVIWSSNVPNSMVNSSARLLDFGNIVFVDNSNGRTTWGSFQYPSDSFLEKMTLTSDGSTGEKILLKSWENPSDPSIGSFSAGINLLTIPEFFLWNGSHPYWRSGPWNGQIFIGVQHMTSLYGDGFNVVDNKEGTVSMSFTYANESVLTYIFLNHDGALMQMGWTQGKQEPEVDWLAPETDCGIYGKCGPFGSCNSKDSPICSCLRGFEPKHVDEWNRGNFISGCVRRSYLQCERNSGNSSQESKRDGFLKLTTMKVPVFAVWSPVLSNKCENQCLKNCSCTAYAYYDGIGCMLWSGSLIDIHKFSSDGADLYIHVAYSELDKKRDLKLVIAISVIVGSIMISICSYFIWMVIVKQRVPNLELVSGFKKKSNEMLPFKKRSPEYSTEVPFEDNLNQVKLEELPLFKFEKLAIATDEFNWTNKLGQGGFGLVYKFPDGREIAVKRLSRSSEQVLEELMNEVVMISKLQHRNLVRLLGCCVEPKEKMLVYEYMPNKSLDAFLFDPQKQKLLDWSKRFDIIEGIGRGLLYLHRDSRLRIIHRDLKANNILLDEELNLKFQILEWQGFFVAMNTKPIREGLLEHSNGYMAPEYAMQGSFSEKSDVFSFGVLLLEIVSGRRKTSFYNDEQSLSLLGYVNPLDSFAFPSSILKAWKLWKEDNIVLLIDPMISYQDFRSEILRCVHVGLLCVQEFAIDRPTISMVLSMLNSEISHLPTPKQPAFTQTPKNLSSQQSQSRCSRNELTVTIVDGR